MLCAIGTRIRCLPYPDCIPDCRILNYGSAGIQDEHRRFQPVPQERPCWSPGGNLLLRVPAALHPPGGARSLSQLCPARSPPSYMHRYVLYARALTTTHRRCHAPERMRALWAVLVLAGSVCADLQHSTSVEVRARDNWTLEARWNDSGEARAYEVQVARTDLFQVMFQGNVSAAEKLGAWVWRSPLPLQCADHSVRVRSFNSTGVSAWSQWATNKGQQNVPSTTARVFPTGEVLLEGSSALFCCIPPVGAQVTEIQFSHRPYDMTAIDQHVRVIRVDSLNCTKLGVTTSCWTNTTRSKSVLNYVTFPPERPQNLSCWTTDLQSIKCSWTAGRPPNLSNKNYQRRYTLRVQDSDQAEVQCDEDPCVFPALPGRIFYNITVVVRNKLGEENQSYAFHFSQVLFPVPESVIVTAEVTDANVSWDLRGNFSGLHFICQILLEPTGNTTELQFVARSRQQRVSVIVQQLQPNTMYSTRGRCALQGNDWGPWTASQTFHTVPLVTLDIWTNIRQQVHNRMLTVLWKTLPSGSEVDIVEFEVCVEPCSAHSPRFVKELQVNFTVGFGECTVSVRALTSRGPSVKSRISVPALYAENLLREKRIVGNAKGFELSWSSLSSATCGYTVEWCMTSPTVPCDLRWRRVPANQTSLLLSEGEGFRKGCRYTFRIFSCQAEGHQVHEKHIGYLEEQRQRQAAHSQAGQRQKQAEHSQAGQRQKQAEHSQAGQRQKQAEHSQARQRQAEHSQAGQRQAEHSQAGQRQAAQSQAGQRQKQAEHSQARQKQAEHSQAGQRQKQAEHSQAGQRQKQAEHSQAGQRQAAYSQAGQRQKQAEHSQAGQRQKQAEHSQAGQRQAEHSQAGQRQKQAEHSQAGQRQKQAEHSQAGQRQAGQRQAAHSQAGQRQKQAEHSQAGQRQKQAAHSQAGQRQKQAEHSQARQKQAEHSQAGQRQKQAEHSQARPRQAEHSQAGQRQAAYSQAGQRQKQAEHSQAGQRQKQAEHSQAGQRQKQAEHSQARQRQAEHSQAGQRQAAYSQAGQRQKQTEHSQAGQRQKQAEHSQAGQRQAGHSQAEQRQAEHSQAGQRQAEHSQAEQRQAEHSQARQRQAEHSQAGQRQAEHRQAGQRQAEHSQAGQRQAEHRPLDTPELLHPMTISWPTATLHWRFNETDPSHPGFITGYRLIIQDHADCSDSKVFLNISVDDPHCKSVLVEGLQPSRSYTVCLTACTQAGCGADSAQTITTTQNLYLLLAKVVTPLLMLIGCCLCLWPCRETLKGITGDIFSVPSAQSMKVLELNDSLFE
ncbi:hypothetical protein NFI96_018701, partial [Prochilodus magdalenae]